MGKHTRQVGEVRTTWLGHLRVDSGDMNMRNRHFPHFFLIWDLFLEEIHPNLITYPDLTSLSFNQFLENISDTAPILNYFFFQLIEKIKILWYRVATKETFF